jgi:hypothetical protein
MKRLTSSRVARLTILTSTAACGVLIAGSLPADAATNGPDNITINCNSAYIATGVTVTQGVQGDFKVKQNSSTPSETTKYWALNVNTNKDLPNKSVSNGQTATWTNVVAGKYQIKAVIASSQKCSTYKASYTVTYAG